MSPFRPKNSVIVDSNFSFDPYLHHYRLNYCNSIVHGASSKVLNKLSVHPKMLFAYSSNLMASYVTNLIHHHTSSHGLHCPKAKPLSPLLSTKHGTWSDRTSIAALSLWNSLPKHIWDCTNLSMFKTQITAHLFKMALTVCVCVFSFFPVVILP